MASDKIEIIDFSGEKFSLISIPCSVSLSITCLLVILNGIFMVAFPGSFITIILSLFLILIMLLYFINWVNNSAKLRKFSISEDIIEITLPHVSRFHKYWSEFDKIEITKRTSQTGAILPGTIIIGPRFVYFNLIFTGKDFKQAYEFESGKDFKRSSRKKLVFALEEYAEKKNKEYHGPKK